LAGNLTVIVKDANNCQATSNSVVLTQPAQGINAFPIPLLTEHIKCFGQTNGKATISANGGILPYVFDWQTSSVSTSETATDLKAGTHQVKVSDQTGCFVMVEIVITEPA